MTKTPAQGTTRVLVAARLSRVTEKGVSRLERDDEKAQQWAKAQGDRRVVATSKDPGISGGTNPFKRPGLGPYLAKPELLAQYDEIVASSLDRLGRNARDLADLRNWAEDNGKRLTILSPQLSWPPAPDDFASPIIWDVLGRVAEMELHIITKRYADQRAYLRSVDSFIGRPVWGFKIMGLKGDKTLVPDPTLAPYLREMVDRTLRGDTLLSICRWLDSEGVKPRLAEGAGAVAGKRGGSLARWSPTSVRELLRQPALKGQQRSRKDGRVLYRHEGVIDVETWNRLQAALDSRVPKRGPATGPAAMLTGSIFCELCGGPMYRYRNVKTLKDGTKKAHEYYKCKGLDQAPSTCRNMVRVDVVEQWLNAWFTEDGPFADTELVEMAVLPGSDHSADIAEIEAQIRDLDLDDPDYDLQLESLRIERNNLKALPAEVAKIEQRPTGYTVGQVWTGLATDARRRFLSAAGVQVHVLPAKPDDAAEVASRVGPDRLYKNLTRTGRHWHWVTGDPARVTGELRYLKP